MLKNKQIDTAFKQAGIAKPKAKRERKGGKLDVSRMPAQSIERQSVERRLTALRASIDADLKRLKSAINSGRTERALVLCGLVASKRGDFLGLVSRLNAGLAMEPLPDPQAKPSRSGLKVNIKAKRYNRWSDK